MALSPYVAPAARALDRTGVGEGVRIEEQALFRDRAVVRGQARLRGRAKVGGGAVVEGQSCLMALPWCWAAR